MEQDEFDVLHEHAFSEALISARADIEAANLPQKIAIYLPGRLAVGIRGNYWALRLLEELQSSFGERLPEFIAAAVRMSAFSLALSSAYMAAGQKSGLIGSNDYTNRFITPDGYGECEGVAWTLYNYIVRPVSKQDLQEFSVCDGGLKMEDLVMRAFALHSFLAASEAFNAQESDRGLNLLGEAYDAISIVEFSRGWHADNGDRMNAEGGEGAQRALEQHLNERRRVLSINGAKGAAEKNKKHAALKEWAVKQASHLRGDDMSVAKRLSAVLPPEHAGVSMNPQRFIYDALRKRTDR